MEEWKDIKGYEGYYQVSNEGRIKSVDRYITVNHKTKHIKEKILKPFITSCGYLQVELCKEHQTKVKVHRLVAEAFIPNPDNLPFVNHKDECKTNNVVSNLEWCTAEYNVNYGTRNKRTSESMKGIVQTKEHIKKRVIKLSIPVGQYTMDGKLVKVWSSIMEAQRNGYHCGAISACCKGKRPHHWGYIWKYI